MKYVIASRGSKLAFWQAEYVKSLLEKRFPKDQWEIQTFVTTGDKFQNRPLSDFGGKGAFLKEIEEALLAGAANLAVHSLKDVPAQETSGLQLSAFLPREDPRDVWISREAEFGFLPKGKIVGTSSLRRQILVRFYTDQLDVRQLRGNLDTRLRKLNEGQYDAIVVAAAGLNRLQLFDESYMQFLKEDAFVPAAGQGILVIQTSVKQKEIQLMVHELNDPISEQCGKMERKFLSHFFGGCHLPIGALALKREGEWHMTGLLGGVKSDSVIQYSLQHSDPESCPDLLAAQLKQMGADRLLAELDQ